MFFCINNFGVDTLHLAPIFIIIWYIAQAGKVKMNLTKKQRLSPAGMGTRLSDSTARNRLHISWYNRENRKKLVQPEAPPDFSDFRFRLNRRTGTYPCSPVSMGICPIGSKKDVHRYGQL